MPRLAYSAAAKQDLKELSKFIARDKRKAAEKWLLEIRQKCQLIARFPEMGEERFDLKPGMRVSVFGNYLIFYRMEAKRVLIVRVMSGFRDIRLL
jgi:toxin ParE1/3/4